MTPRSVRSGRVTVAVAFVVCAIAATACGALLPMAGRLLATAVGNYDSRYGRMVEELTDTLRKQEAPVRPASPTETPTPEPQSLTLEVALLKQVDVDGELRAEPMRDGDVLTHRGSLDDADRFKIFFRPSETAFVYVVLVDATGWVQVLHPSDGVGVATPAESGRFLPEGELDLAFAVDGHTGIETIYFVAARERRSDLERVLAGFVGRTRPEPRTDLGVTELGDDLVTIGVRARSADATAAVTTATRDVVRFDTEAFASVAGKDLVVTRWFRHR
jgi:hypothetical protein